MVNYQLPFTYNMNNLTTGLIKLLVVKDKGHHSSLWLETTTFEESQRGYLRSEVTTAHSSQKPQRLKSHKILDSIQMAE